jgi:hypothetical protein
VAQCDEAQRGGEVQCMDGWMVHGGEATLRLTLRVGVRGKRKGVHRHIVKNGIAGMNGIDKAG